MKVNQAEIIISAVSKKQYPTDFIPEFALAGRSNVGKSSFINKLIQRKSLARTSSKPGKTQTLNFYKINNIFHFVDVPGYGYAKVSKSEKDKWGEMMEEYFSSRDMLKAVFLITDIRHAPSKDDIRMYEFLKHHDQNVVVIATKLDKIPKSKKDAFIKRTKLTLGMESSELVIPFSSETSEGKEAVWSLLESYL